jgi:hypothetical protein
MQSIAAAACKSGAMPEDVMELARLGSHGLHEGNIHRDLLAKFCHNIASPLTMAISVPLKVRDHDGSYAVKACETHVLLPHEWLAALAASGTADGVLGTLDDISAFWQKQLPDNPKFQGAGQILLNLRDKANMVPLLLHGDGVQFAEYDSLMVFSMRAITSKLQVKASQLLLSAIAKSCTSPSTWDEVWKWLRWSLEACFLGRHPIKGPCGEALEGERLALAGKALGFRACIFVVAGDLDFLANSLGLPHSSAHEMCTFCRANRSTLPYTDLRPSAAWTAHRRPADSSSELSPHAIFKLPGVTINNIHVDQLHALEYGPVAHALGNVLVGIVEDNFRVGRDRAMVALNQEIQQIYAELSIEPGRRVKDIGWKDIKPNPRAYPFLKHEKANRLRHLVPVAKELCERYRKTSDPSSQHRFELLRNLDRFYEIVDAHGMFLPPAAWKELSDSMQSANAHYGWLAKDAVRKALLRWSVVPKHHACFHLAEQAQYLSPKASWTYGSESYVGVIAALGQACVSGTAAHKLSAPLFQKYRVAMHLHIAGIID